jgi:quercetin dioxygenase-like cupin family protein
MDLVNAIAKVRFASASPQRVSLHKGQSLNIDMLCMENGQEIRVHGGEWAYYVVAGVATVSAGGLSVKVPMGQLSATAPDEPHMLANADEDRLVCLAFGKPA